MIQLKKQTFLRDSLLLLLTAIVGGSWVYDLQMEERVVTIRYLVLAAAGFIAFITPYLMFPDVNAKNIQLGNIREKKLLTYLVCKTLSVYKYFFLFLCIVMLIDFNTPLEELPVKLHYTIYAILMTVGLHFGALYLYLKTGGQSQFWQESERGRELRRKIAEYAKYPIDPGAIPSLINTILIASTGMVLSVIAATLNNSFGILSELTVGVSLFVTTALLFFRFSTVPEKRYYQTNSFYSEFFGESVGEDTITARRKVEQLWWVPGKLRANVWQFLQQIDRKIPAGRVIAAGHVLVWIVAYQKPDSQFMLGVWVLFGLLHHLFIIQTMQGDFSPHWLLRWMGSPSTWFFSWFWMQIRWILPLVLSMMTQLFIFGVPDWSDQLTVIIIYLCSAALVAASGSFRLKRSIA